MGDHDSGNQGRPASLIKPDPKGQDREQTAGGIPSLSSPYKPHLESLRLAEIPTKIIGGINFSPRDATQVPATPSAVDELRFGRKPSTSASVPVLNRKKSLGMSVALLAV